MTELLVAAIVLIVAIIIFVTLVRRRPRVAARPAAGPPDTADMADTAEIAETAEIAQAPEAGKAERFSDEAGTFAAPVAEAPPGAEAPAHDAAPPPGPAPAAAEAAAAPRAFRDRIAKARNALRASLSSALGRRTIDAETWDDLEEALIGADVGVGATTQILADLEQRAAREGIRDPESLIGLLRDEIETLLAGPDRALAQPADGLAVFLMVGVNGVGKTTTIAKIAHKLIADGNSVVLAAADTFRAAAAEQLEIWGGRVGAHVVRGQEGSDPGAIAFDAVGFAKAHGANYLVIDTAGRLHTKSNLMEELKKIARVVDKAGASISEVLLVLDATTGQNGLIQAREFGDAVGVTGVVLAKLDGTARGGIVLAVERELGIPVKLVGIGETPVDLIPFDPAEFAEALFE